MRDSEEFKLVTNRKKRAPKIRTICHSSTFLSTNNDNDDDHNINYETVFG